eukprot:snap_masked-scaffold_1-processed-gene-30.50-mRNA-1 protein AED:1.00 eAED:1.00 QI:0/-1/0/0/-1/1/1/0/269
MFLNQVFISNRTPTVSILCRSWTNIVRKPKTKLKAAKKRKQKAKTLRASKSWDIKKDDKVFCLLPELSLPKPEKALQGVSEEIRMYIKNQYKSDRINFVNSLTRNDGEIGKVIKVDRIKSRALIENVNVEKFTYEDVFGNEKTEEREGYVDYNRIFLVDPKDELPTTIKNMFDEDSGFRYRVSERSGEIIPWPEYPSPSFETYENDSTEDMVNELTYVKGEDFNRKEFEEKLMSDFSEEKIKYLKGYHGYLYHKHGQKEAPRKNKKGSK